MSFFWLGNECYIIYTHQCSNLRIKLVNPLPEVKQEALTLLKPLLEDNDISLTPMYDINVKLASMDIYIYIYILGYTNHYNLL